MTQITRRKIYRHKIPIKLSNGQMKTYMQYSISLPKEFAEQFTNEEVCFIGDSVGLITQDKEMALKILKKFPNLRKFVLKRKEK